MKASKLLREVHYWLSLAVMIPLGIMIIAGLFLMLKKDVTWIQPPTARGVAPDAVPAQDFAALFAAAQGVEELALRDWTDLARVDVKPGKGVIKFIAENNWEAQIDTQTGAVLQVALRRSDVIEQIHDGSFFSDGVKLFVFLPAGFVLLILWATGIYLFALPQMRNLEKARKRRRAAPAV